MGPCSKSFPLTRLAAGLFLCLTAWSQAPGSAETILRHAIELHQAGDIDGAIREYRAYLKQNPENVIALSNLGAALSRSGHYEEATVEYRRALKKDPANLPVRLNLALAYYKTSRIGEAAGRTRNGRQAAAGEPAGRLPAGRLRPAARGK